MFDNLAAFMAGSGYIALIVGAGDVGYPFGQVLMKCSDPGHWRYIFTRRTQAAADQLREQIAREIPRANDRNVFVSVLDPGSQTECFMFLELLRQLERRVELLVLASGKAMLDTEFETYAESQSANIAANTATKFGVYALLQSASLLGKNSMVVVASSKVLDFADDAPEISTQRGYRSSMQSLEQYFRNQGDPSPNQDHEGFPVNAAVEVPIIEMLRVPLVEGRTADQFKSLGIVGSDVVPQYMGKIAHDTIQKVFQTHSYRVNRHNH